MLPSFGFPTSFPCPGDCGLNDIEDFSQSSYPLADAFGGLHGVRDLTRCRFPAFEKGMAVFGDFVLMVVDEWDHPIELLDNNICWFRSLLYQECSTGRFTAFPYVFERPKTWGKDGGQSLWLTLPPELTDYVVDSLSPDDRFWLGTVSKFFAHVVKRHWMSRLRAVLAPFLLEQTTKLLSELSTACSFLVGSVLFNVLLDGPRPDNLNFITPKPTGQSFLVALCELSGFSVNKGNSGMLKGTELLLDSFTVRQKVTHGLVQVQLWHTFRNE
ncbi:hypothetical protein C8J56DRAFT_890050 [Mycena floridula]|nr:hypothetical protein C8J56DRAFT_890050 [Mycena floridula]